MLFVNFPLPLIFFLCMLLLLVWLICVLACFSFCLSFIDSLCFLDLVDFPFPFREIFDYNIFKYFLRLFLFFLLESYNLNVGMYNVVPEVCKTVLNSFRSLFCSIAVIYTILSSSSFICSVSVIPLLIPSSLFFHFSYCVAHHWL